MNEESDQENQWCKGKLFRPTTAGAQCHGLKGRKEKQQTTISKGSRLCLEDPPLGVALSGPLIEYLQGLEATTLEASHRHLQGTSYHDFLLKVSSCVFLLSLDH